MHYIYVTNKNNNNNGSRDTKHENALHVVKLAAKKLYYLSEFLILGSQRGHFSAYFHDKESKNNIYLFTKSKLKVGK